MQTDLHANKYIYTVNCLLRSLREICNSLLLNSGSRVKKKKKEVPTPCRVGSFWLWHHDSLARALIATPASARNHLAGSQQSETERLIKVLELNPGYCLPPLVNLSSTSHQARARQLLLTGSLKQPPAIYAAPGFPPCHVGLPGYLQAK